MLNQTVDNLNATGQVLPNGITFRQKMIDRLQESAAIKQNMCESPDVLAALEFAAKNCISSLKSGGCIFFCGNGGSAADAQHLSAELSGRFYYDRSPYRAEALHANSSFLTAVANDYSYSEIYSRLLQGQGKKGDVLICLSTSGNSENIVKAAEMAKQMGIETLAFTGEKGGKLKSVCSVCVCVPSIDTARIQEMHITMGHILCEIIECTLSPKT